MNIKMTLKILCLHGFRHNSTLLKRSMESITKKLRKLGVEFDFFESPILYSGDDNNDNSKDFKQWWSATKETVQSQEKYDTLEQSIENLKVKWQNYKYDGIIGYSQGSVLVQIFAYMIQNKIIDTYEPKFLILSSTFPITDVRYKDLYKEKLRYPTIIMAGTNDTFVKIF